MKHKKQASVAQPAAAAGRVSAGPNDDGVRERASWLPTVLPAVLAMAMIVVPWLALSWPGLLAGEASWAPAPFGFQAILLAHLLGLVALGLWSAALLVRWARATWGLLRRDARQDGREQRDERRPAEATTGVGVLGVGIPVLLALGLALLSAVSATGAASLASGDRLLTHPLRLGWVYLLELPWAVALMASVPTRRWWFQPTAIDGVIGLLLALLPVAHVGQVVQREDRLLGESLAHAQYQEAWRLVERLAAVGDYPIQGRPAAAMRKVLMQRVTELRKATAEPLATEATEDERVRRGRDLMSLGRLDEARALLTPLVQQTPEASLYLGAIAEVAGQWLEAAAAYRQTIDRVKQQDATTEASQRWIRAAYERYANNLRRAGDPLEAERQLKQGMEDWPSLRDLFLLQLGYHYQMAGRVWESRDFFEQAAVANPALAAEVQIELEKLRTEAQGCLLRPTRGAAR
jgi:hypothetical protein